MNTSLIAVLICFGLCIKIALTIAAIHYFQRPSLKGTLKQKRKGGQRKAVTREKKDVSTATQESSPKPIIKEPAVSPTDKPRKPIPIANEKQSEIKAAVPKASVTSAAITETKRIGKTLQEPPSGKTPEGERKMMKVITGPPHKKGEKIELVDIRKQMQPKNTIPPQFKKPMGLSKDSSVSRTAATGAPQKQAAVTAQKSVGKPPQEPVTTDTSAGEIDKGSGSAEPEVTAVKENEAGTGDNQENSEPSAEKTEPEEKEEDKAQKEKSGLGDLADLFATSASDFTEKSKLAEQVGDVDVNILLQEGRGLLGKVKKPEK